MCLDKSQEERRRRGMAKRVTVGRDHVQVKVKFPFDNALMMEYACSLSGSKMDEFVKTAALAAAKMLIYETEMARKAKEEGGKTSEIGSESAT
jgi:uncharacterized protein (DUF1778 family)